MKDKTLVDTSIWIEFFRSKTKIGDRLEILLKENSVWTCGVVIFEILQGIKSEKEKTKILGVMENLPYVEMTKTLWQRSAEISIFLKKAGLNLPLSDIYLAALAIENDLSICSLDNHFTQIPNLRRHIP